MIEPTPFGDLRSILHAETIDAQALRRAILGRGGHDELWVYAQEILKRRHGATAMWGWGVPPARCGVLLGWPHWWSEAPTTSMGASVEVTRVRCWDGVALEVWRADASAALHLWACDMLELALTTQAAHSAHMPLAWQATRAKRRWLTAAEPAQHLKAQELEALAEQLDAVAMCERTPARAKLVWAARWCLALTPLPMIDQLGALLPLSALDPRGERLVKHLERLDPHRRRVVGAR